MINDYENELTKAALDVAKDLAKDVARPTAISIGDNIGLMVDGVMGWLGCWGEKQKIKQQLALEEYKQQITAKILSIDPERLCEPQISTIGPALEASKFFCEEAYYREMFSSLIAASCNTEKTASVHPAFVEIIKQLSPLDAKLFNMFNYRSTYPCIDVVEKHSNNLLTPFTRSLFDFYAHADDFSLSEYLHITSSLDNLIRLGLVKKNDQILELDYDYSQFSSDSLFKQYCSIIKKDSTIETKLYRIELTEFGKAFSECCF